METWLEICIQVVGASFSWQGQEERFLTEFGIHHRMGSCDKLTMVLEFGFWPYLSSPVMASRTEAAAAEAAAAAGDEDTSPCKKDA